VDPVVDRIGSGDAFAAALLAARIERMPDDRALEFAVAACCLKLGVAGDFNLVSRPEIEASMAGNTRGLRR
jgi:2-dehydro-3-deoxygluconokinase